MQTLPIVDCCGDAGQRGGLHCDADAGGSSKLKLIIWRYSGISVSGLPCAVDLAARSERIDELEVPRVVADPGTAFWQRPWNYFSITAASRFCNQLSTYLYLQPTESKEGRAIVEPVTFLDAATPHSTWLGYISLNALPAADLVDFFEITAPPAIYQFIDI